VKRKKPIDRVAALSRRVAKLSSRLYECEELFKNGAMKRLERASKSELLLHELKPWLEHVHKSLKALRRAAITHDILDERLKSPALDKYIGECVKRGWHEPPP